MGEGEGGEEQFHSTIIPLTVTSAPVFSRLTCGERVLTCPQVLGYKAHF